MGCVFFFLGVGLALATKDLAGPDVVALLRAVIDAHGEPHGAVVQRLALLVCVRVEGLTDFPTDDERRLPATKHIHGGDHDFGGGLGSH